MFTFFKKKKRKLEHTKSPEDKIREALPDLEVTVVDRIASVLPFTMTSVERISALIDAVNYVVDQGINGDIVECGVWRGGSMMAVAQTLASRQCASRALWLYDTFEGMSPPEERDVDHVGHSAAKLLADQSPEDPTSVWCQCSLEEVKKNLAKVDYPQEQIHFLKGPVEKTIPDLVPEKIALLRLDTDWYQSTKHELIHLFPRLADGGVLIIDDYGHWQGCRQAVDEYFRNINVPILLNRIDYTGRMGVKLPMLRSTQQAQHQRNVA